MSFKGRKIDDFMKSLKAKINDKKAEITELAKKRLESKSNQQEVQSKTDKKGNKVKAALMAATLAVTGGVGVAMNIKGYDKSYVETIDEVSREEETKPRAESEEIYDFVSGITPNQLENWRSFDFSVFGIDAPVAKEDVDLYVPYTVTASELNVRAEPSINGKIVYILGNGGTIYLREDDINYNEADEHNWKKILIWDPRKGYYEAYAAADLGYVEKNEDVHRDFATCRARIKDEALSKYTDKTRTEKSLESVDFYEEYRGRVQDVNIEDFSSNSVRFQKRLIPLSEAEVYVPYELITGTNIRSSAEVSNESNNVLITPQTGERIYVYENDTTIYNFEDSYDWKKVMYVKSDGMGGTKLIEGYIASKDDYAKRVDNYASCKVKIKDEPQIEEVVPQVEGAAPQAEEVENQSYESTTNPNRTDCSDSTELVIDMLDCSHFDEFKSLVDSGKIGACIFSVGNTDQGKTFKMDIYQDDENEYLMYSGTENEEKLMDGDFKQLMEKYNANKKSYEEPFIVSTQYTRTLKNMENYIEYAISKGLKVGFYYYTLAMNDNQVSAEAAYMYTLYNKLENDIPALKNAGTELPFIIDIETGGDSRDPYIDTRTYYAEQLIKLLGKGSDAKDVWAIDGVNPKDGYGVIDKDFVLYSALNRYDHPYINFDQFKNDLTNEGYEMYNWYARQLLKESVHHDDYNKILDENGFLDDILNDDYCIKYVDFVDESAMIQGYLDAAYKSTFYDISITPKGNLEKMAKGEKLTKFVGDLRDERAVDPKAKTYEDENER